jgi:hypothetical protein
MESCRLSYLALFALLAWLTGCQALRPSFRFAPQSAVMESPKFPVESADSVTVLNAFGILSSRSKPPSLIAKRSTEVRKRISYSPLFKPNPRYTRVYRRIPLQVARADTLRSDKTAANEGAQKTGLIIIVCGLLVGLIGAAVSSGGSLSAGLTGLNILLAGGVLLFVGLLVYFLASRS